jgi:hypothetical protein
MPGMLLSSVTGSQTDGKLIGGKLDPDAGEKNEVGVVSGKREDKIILQTL